MRYHRLGLEPYSAISSYLIVEPSVHRSSLDHTTITWLVVLAFTARDQSNDFNTTLASHSRRFPKPARTLLADEPLPRHILLCLPRLRPNVSRLPINISGHIQHCGVVLRPATPDIQELPNTIGIGPVDILLS